MDFGSLYHSAVAGDKEAEKKLFSGLSERFEAFLHRRIWNEEDARDVLQNAMMDIAREYKEIGIEKSFLAWAYKLLDYRILSYIKRKKQRGDKVVSVADASMMQNITVGAEPGLKMMLLNCLRKIGRFNRNYARIIDLHYLGFRAEDIVDRLKITANGFYVILHRARKMLEKCLETGEIK